MSESAAVEAAKMVSRSYIVRLAGCADCLNTKLALCADENGYRTKNLMARRALVTAERALQGIRVTQNAVWSKGGSFTTVVKYEGAPAMDAMGHLGLTLEYLGEAEGQLTEYVESPAAIAEDLPPLQALLEWVIYCQWDLGHLRDSPKPEVR